MPRYNNLNTPTTLAFNFEEGLRGYEAIGTNPGADLRGRSAQPGELDGRGDWTPALPAELVGSVIPGSDVLVIRHASAELAHALEPVHERDGRYRRRRPSRTTREATSPSCRIVRKRRSFRVTSVANTAGGIELRHVAAGTPGNQTPSWGTDQEYAGRGSPRPRRDVGVLCRRTARAAARRRCSSAACRSDGATTSATLVAEELVEAAETMQVRYGIDAALDGDHRFVRDGEQRHELGPSRHRARRIGHAFAGRIRHGSRRRHLRRRRNGFRSRRRPARAPSVHHHECAFGTDCHEPREHIFRHSRTARSAALRLIVAMVMLLAMTLLGVTAMRNTTLQERMAGNLRDSNLAFQSAERALREGEKFLRSPTIPPFTGADGLLTMQDDAGQGSFWNGLRLGRKRHEPPRASRSSERAAVRDRRIAARAYGGRQRTVRRVARRRLLSRHGASRRRHYRRGSHSPNDLSALIRNGKRKSR